MADNKTSFEDIQRYKIFASTQKKIIACGYDLSQFVPMIGFW